MTPEEKAQDLFLKFTPESFSEVHEESARREGKEMACICVDELLKYKAECPFPYEMEDAYWKNVKKEIQKL